MICFFCVLPPQAGGHRIGVKQMAGRISAWHVVKLTRLEFIKKRRKKKKERNMHILNIFIQ